MLNPNRFYVYVHRDINGVLFYVGKGTRQRAWLKKRENTKWQEIADKGFTVEIVKDKLLELKEEYREILILRFINDLDLDEIADVTGKSKGNVRVFLHRALKSLKDLVEKDREKKKL